jgi:translation initiation factor IF-3
VFIFLSVTPANQHLEVNLFDDENKQSLGQMPLMEAHKLAKFRELILVLFDESHDPPDVRLMTGKKLAQIRDETRANKKQDLVNDKITDFVLRLRPHIAENDLLTKIGQAKAAYSKGSSIRFSLDFGRAIDEKETEKLVSVLDDYESSAIGDLTETYIAFSL